MTEEEVVAYIRAHPELAEKAAKEAQFTQQHQQPGTSAPAASSYAPPAAAMAPPASVPVAAPAPAPFVPPRTASSPAHAAPAPAPVASLPPALPPRGKKPSSGAASSEPNPFAESNPFED
eukprot:TRINITY_DN51561_c0_g1_i1.p2 TRINITY_DN51561_c0_g1~~TRINITY_DN51561_c0_g1_i1.p2  ORF type:complete len:140 (+),score=17.69 TRINITY_DN51561_c0_g1_i1:63-422(+)